MSTPKYCFEASQLIREGRVNEADITQIKSWSLNQKHVPNLTEEQIVLFLLSCCNDCEATKSTIDAFYKLRKSNPDLFNDRNVERTDLQKTLKTTQMCVFPKRTSSNYAILLVRLQDTTYYNLDMGPVIKTGLMTLDSVVYENPPDGFITIIDMKGVGLMHLTRITFKYLKPFFRYIQEALPVRLEGILVLNTVYFINKIMAIIKPFMNPKLMEKIHFHTPDMDIESFLERFVDMHCIPSDYGGNGPSVEQLHLLNIKRLENMATHFEAEELQRSDLN